ncbi:MAG: hypothetical protein R2748_33695 [Bryobacterales bacterium]
MRRWLASRIVSIFGSGMMEGVVGMVLANGQTSFQGTTVRIGGIPAPIFALSATAAQEQINVQVPFELTPGQSTTVEIENNVLAPLSAAFLSLPHSPAFSRTRPVLPPPSMRTIAW